MGVWIAGRSVELQSVERGAPIEKYLRLRGLVQFKHVLLQGQLYYILIVSKFGYYD